MTKCKESARVDRVRRDLAQKLPPGRKRDHAMRCLEKAAYWARLAAQK